MEDGLSGKVQSSTAQQKHNMSHIHNLKCFWNLYSKYFLEGEINVNNTVYVTQYISNIIISMCTL